jgi:hypothetical protein
MKLALFIVLVVGSSICYAQNANSDPQSALLSETPPPIPAPLLVLRIAGETIELDPDSNDVPDVESLDSNWMSSIEFVDAVDASLQYGHKGRNGVIIIQFKDNYIPPASLKFKVRDGR